MFTTRVLLIEDNPAEAKLITRIIDKSDVLLCTITHKSSLESATEYLIENMSQIDIILLDLNLSDSEYSNTLHSIVSNFNSIPIILLTNMDPSIGLKGIEMGAEDYMNKNELSQSLVEKTILYAIKRSKNRKTMTLLNQIDPLTNTLKKDSFCNLVNKCIELQDNTNKCFMCKIILPDELYQSSAISVNEIIRGLVFYLENLFTSALLGCNYSIHNNSLRFLLQSNEDIDKEFLEKNINSYVRSTTGNLYKLDISLELLNVSEEGFTYDDC